MMGATDPANIVPGTVRGVFAPSILDQRVHGADSSEPAEREIELWFGV
jgi:nucleoside-diphosphate kinase